VYLSYSGYKTYKSCPRSYYHRYVGKTVLEKPDNRVNSLYGSTVGTIFELFYSDKVWSRSGVEDHLKGLVDDVLAQILERESKSGVIDWADDAANYHSLEELREDVLTSIPRGLDIIRYHRLLGKDAAAEVKLDSHINGHMIGGRADFIMTRIDPHRDLVILDGKGSRHRGKYVDHQQLWWYAMLYQVKFGRMPDKLGFVFWRQEPEKSLDWVNFDAPSLRDLQTGVFDVIEHIDHGKAELAKADHEEARTIVLRSDFMATPGKDCRLCAYLPVCPEGTAHKSLSAPDHAGSGVEDVGL
jgi:hypothetical protein